MKKKILFMLINMNVGGTEKALLNMISQMPKNEYDITILMLEKYGGFLDSIPSNIQIKYVENYKDIKTTINEPPRTVAKNLFQKGKIIKGINLLFAYFISKIFNNKVYFFQYVTKKVPKLTSEYDIAVAYAGPMDFISFFVLRKICAKRKLQWIHFDIEKIGFDPTFAKKNYRQFEKIYVVSEVAKSILVKAVPSIKTKVDVSLNLVLKDKILKESKQGVGFKDDFLGTRILTVGRLANQKGQDIAIKVLSRLINEGFNVRWYCLGEGATRNECEWIIRENHLENHFILLGSDPNPYPFMEQCDLYVQPSRHEGYCITLAEVKFFNKPIVTTNFTGASEQIIDKKTGFIVNINETEIYLAIKKVLEDESIQKSFRQNLILENDYKNTNKKVILDMF